MEEEEKTKPYELPPTKPNTVKEPFTMYGTLNLDESKRYTYADYLTWLDDKRRELINGFIHLMSAPMRVHAHVSMELSTFIKVFLKKRKGKCRIYHAPFDVRLPLSGEIADDKIYDVVQPDICVICDIFLLQPDGKYDLGTVYECNQKAPVHIFEGLEIDLDELFEY